MPSEFDLPLIIKAFKIFTGNQTEIMITLKYVFPVSLKIYQNNCVKEIK